MVWAGITSHARTELVPILNGALSAQRYVEEVLMEHVVPFGYGDGENFILMQDTLVLMLCNAYLNFWTLLVLKLWSGRLAVLISVPLNTCGTSWGSVLKLEMFYQRPCKSFKEGFSMNGEKLTNR